MDLKQLVKQLADTRKLANTDLEAVHRNVRPSMTMMVNDAKDRLEKLKHEYSQYLRSNTLGLFLFGDPSRVNKFFEIAAEEAGMNLIQGDTLYQRIADRVEPSLGMSREFGPTQMQMMIQELDDIAKEMGIRRMDKPRLAELSATPDRISLVAYIRKLTRAVLDDELLRLFLDRRINEMAIDQQFAGKSFPLCVVGLDPVEVPGLAAIFTNSFTVDVGTSSDGEVNKDYVLNQLMAFRKKIRSKTNNEPA